MGLGRNRGNTPRRGRHGDGQQEIVAGTRRALFAEYSKTLQMRRRELDRYLIELAEQKTWIEGARFMLADPARPKGPGPATGTNTPSGCRTSELGNYPGSRAGMIPSSA